MQISADTEDRLVCAVLAAQVAALRDHIEGHAAVEMLWHATDVLSLLSGLVGDLVGNASGAHTAADVAIDPALAARCASAVAAQAEVSRSLEDLAMFQAQHHDLARQMAECVVSGLQSLAAEDGRLSARELAALYVCEDQRRIHETVARQFGAPKPEDRRKPRKAGRQPRVILPAS
jgi:hypothetical protein